MFAYAYETNEPNTATTNHDTRNRDSPSSRGATVHPALSRITLFSALSDDSRPLLRFSLVTQSENEHSDAARTTHARMGHAQDGQHTRGRSPACIHSTLTHCTSTTRFLRVSIVSNRDVPRSFPRGWDAAPIPELGAVKPAPIYARHSRIEYRAARTRLRHSPQSSGN